MNKEINWDTAPAWANIYAVDKTGACWFFNKMPKIRKQDKIEMGWDFTNLKYQFVKWSDAQEINNWKKSLTRRPAAQNKEL